MHISSHLILSTTLARWYSCPHFKEEETDVEKLTDLSSVKHLVSGWTVWKPSVTAQRGWFKETNRKIHTLTPILGNYISHGEKNINHKLFQEVAFCNQFDFLLRNVRANESQWPSAPGSSFWDVPPKHSHCGRFHVSPRTRNLVVGSGFFNVKATPLFWRVLKG